MRRTHAILAVGTVTLGVVAAPVVAHHAFGAEFDRNAPIRLEGPVVLISNEVGLGLHPVTALGRAFVDHAGRFQLAGNGIEPSPFGNEQHRRFGERAGRIELSLCVVEHAECRAT